ncbi:CHASE2 domain-containing sensor protein [Lysinibacillus sp. RC79]
MGVWYFLILFVGLFLIFKGLFMKKQSLLIKKIGIVFVGLLCISFSIFMFSPGSAEVISDLLNLE